MRWKPAYHAVAFMSGSRKQLIGTLVRKRYHLKTTAYWRTRSFNYNTSSDFVDELPFERYSCKMLSSKAKSFFTIIYLSIMLEVVKHFRTSHLNSELFHISKSHAINECAIVPPPLPCFEVIPMLYFSAHLYCLEQIYFTAF